MVYGGLALLRIRERVPIQQRAPTRTRGVDREGQRGAPLDLVGVDAGADRRPIAPRQDSRQVLEDHGRLVPAMQRRGHTRFRLPPLQSPHQLLGLAQERLVRDRVVPTLLGEVVEQERHPFVEARIGELLADDGLPDVVDDHLRDALLAEGRERFGRGSAPTC